MNRRGFVLLSLVLAWSLPVQAAGRVEVVAGGEGEAKLVAPFAVDFGEDGSIYFVEMSGGDRLRVIDPKGVVRTLAGTGKKGNDGDGGPGLKASFNGPHHLAVGPDGIIYIADTFNNRIRTYDPKTGLVAAFAGTGEKGFAGDGGPALQAKFGGVYCLAFDATKEKMYVADLDNRRIRVIDMKTRTVSTVAGNGKKGIPEENSVATEAPLVDPRAVAVANPVLYILERSGHALRAVNLETGRIFHAAGTGKAGAALARNALESAFNGPKHLCIDSKARGSTLVLIADSENHRIVRYGPSPGGNYIELVCGTGKKGKSLGGGDPLQCELAQPHGVAVHPKTGAIYIADSTNNRILKISR